MTDNNQPSPQKPEQTSSQSGDPVDTSSKAKKTERKAESTSRSNPPQTVNPPTSPSVNRPTNGGSTLATIAIVLTVLFGGGITLHMQHQRADYQAQMHALRAELNQARSTINTQLSEAKEQAIGATRDIATQAETLLNQQKQSVDSLHLALAEIQGRRPNDWLLAEADYLVKLAGRKLYLERDIETATQLVQEADLRVAELNDPSLTSLRRALSYDIAQLQAMPIIDRDGLVLRLMSLQQRIDQLPLANALLPEEAQPSQPTVSEDIADWKTNLRTSLQAFADNFITFRVRDGQAIPLLSPQQHLYLRENLKAKLDTAIKAVYSEQQDIYTLSLNMALEWSRDYFNRYDQQVKAFNLSLEQLAEQHIQLDTPQLTAQQPLSDVIRERLRRSVAPIMTEGQQ